MLERLKQDLKNDLIAGLLVVIGLATTIWLEITVANWMINFLTRPKQLNPFDEMNPFLVNLMNLAIGLAVPLLCILLIGLMVRNIIGKSEVGSRKSEVIILPCSPALFCPPCPLVPVRTFGEASRRKPCPPCPPCPLVPLSPCLCPPLTLHPTPYTPHPTPHESS